MCPLSQEPTVYLYVLLPVLVFNDSLHLPLNAFGKVPRAPAHVHRQARTAEG